ncbi:H+/gluconate symporter-like permease [Rhizobium subbaraonis]|uniref:H+/gluconate symporter-like permease n=1 Tax=Rhizobium subbaraonis TaxID=908946 RepID=A0A285ULT3_9HYPH|nr:GntP family permease [Rhizobium subbaraonis]SOC42855.1 H+/gluconate symporter-like permease [Rhizobium subbaraonis]
MGLLGIAAGLALLIALAYRGWSILLLAPLAALLAAALSREPLLASWTQIFMPNAAGFFAQYFPLFLLGALFGKLMEDTGSIKVISRVLMDRLGMRRAIVSVVLAGALVTYGGVSLFVAFFVIAPMAEDLFRRAGIPRRLMPAAIVLGTSTFTMSAMPGTPSIQNAIPMPIFGTTPFAAPGLGLIASAIMAAFGLWWLARAERAARNAGEGFGDDRPPRNVTEDPKLREHANAAREFDPAELARGKAAAVEPSFVAAIAPLVTVIAGNMLLSLVVLPSMDAAFLSEPRWGATTLSAVIGVWAVVAALAAGIVLALGLNYRRLPLLRDTIDAGVNASVMPSISVSSLVGFGAVIASLPAFDAVRDWVLGIGGGPAVSLAVATNILSALTGSASGGLTIALEALGPTFIARAHEAGIDVSLLHRVAVISSGTLDTLPHNGAVITLLAVCGTGHRESYRDIAIVSIGGAIIALVAILLIGGMVGSF